VPKKFHGIRTREPEVAKVLELSASHCEESACVELLSATSRLAEAFASRKPLFDRLLPRAAKVGPEAWSALRCLLHGDIGMWREAAILFDETGATPVLSRLLENALKAAKQPWRRVTATAAGELGLTAYQRQCLNLVPASEPNIEALIGEVGPTDMDCSGLSHEECDFILLHFDDVKVLRDLNIHETMDGHRVRIGPLTYVDDDTFENLPHQFNSLVTRLRDRPGYARFASPDGSNQLVKKLSWEAVIEIALGHSSPCQWWDVILTAVSEMEYLRVALRDQIRTVAWLPLANDTAVKPAEVLHVPGVDAELDGLPPNVLFGRVPLLRVSEAVRSHGRFGKFKNEVLPAPNEALPALAALLQSDGAWSTGLSCEWTPELVADWVRTLGEMPEQALPVVRLVKAMHAEDSVRSLLPTFLQSISGRLRENAYAEVLKHLANVHEAATAEARERAVNVILRYLTAVAEAGPGFATTVLKADGVKLVSASGAARAPQKLAFAHDSIHPEDRLDQRISRALEVLRAEQPDLPEPIEEVPDVSDQSAAGLVATLRGLFNPWRTTLSACEPIGALLCLLGAGAQSLSREFFSTWSPEEVLDWLEENDQTRGTLGRIRDRIRRREFRLLIVTEPCAVVCSILGNEFEARLADQPSTLLLPYHGYSIEAWQEDCHSVCRLRLRKLALDRGNYTEEVLLALLRETAGAVLAQALRAKVDVRPLFEKLSKATQLHVAVAQNMIVDQALAFLRQIGAQSHPNLKEALGLWDDARRQEAVEDVHKLISRRSADLRRQAREKIRGLLAGDPLVQAVVLGGVKRKLSEFQYAASSIPFELWQNADDAVAELLKLGIDPSEAAIRLGFVAIDAGDSLVFAHWGRLINEFAGTEGINCRDAGFDRDLEKMLVPAISDKSEISAQGETVLTGKFGLGFKSVFLVTDGPEVLSGSVDFAIRGGIYPVRLNETERTALEATLKMLAPDHWRRGTLIRLPAQTQSAGQVLSLFRRLASLLVVFSRRLKRLRLCSNEEQDVEVRWHPKRLELEGCIEFGALDHLEGGPRRALVLSLSIDNDRAQFLLGLGSDGFLPLPDDVPVFWVTAPTRDTPCYGFAVNGPFEPDVGRVQLAFQSEQNKQLASGLAVAVAVRLVTIWKLSCEDWQGFSEKLDLASGTTAHAFWESLWDMLGRRFADKCPKDDRSPLATLARRILWNSETDGLQCFYRSCPALPTGLWSLYRTLTRLPDLHHVAAGALDREQIFKTVSFWPGFQRRVSVGCICSNRQIASILGRLGVRLDKAESVHLANAVEWELGKDRRADPELAARLGQLITPEFLKKLQEGRPDERDEFAAYSGPIRTAIPI